MGNFLLGSDWSSLDSRFQALLGGIPQTAIIMEMLGFEAQALTGTDFGGHEWFGIICLACSHCQLGHTVSWSVGGLAHLQLRWGRLSDGLMLMRCWHARMVTLGSMWNLQFSFFLGVKQTCKSLVAASPYIDTDHSCVLACRSDSRNSVHVVHVRTLRTGCPCLPIFAPLARCTYQKPWGPSATAKCWLRERRPGTRNLAFNILSISFQYPDTQKAYIWYSETLKDDWSASGWSGSMSS